MLFAMLLFKKATVHDILVTIFGNIYIPFLLSLAILTRKIVPYGEYYIWLPFFGAYVTDATAYFGGTFYGKHKLSPKISPNKTVEGSIIGTISCVISFWLIYVVYFYLFHVPVKFLSLTILSIISSIVSQLGDLFASAIKRYYHIKDFSNLLPGHGGALDRIDSLLFAIPVVYFYVIIFRIV
jgi:phosphatidate cytidylyltransferase